LQIRNHHDRRRNSDDDEQEDSQIRKKAVQNSDTHAQGISYFGNEEEEIHLFWIRISHSVDEEEEIYLWRCIREENSIADFGNEEEEIYLFWMRIAHFQLGMKRRKYTYFGLDSFELDF
jgi:hypothetical protein